MKAHTSDFKNKIKEFGRELDSKITYTIDGTTTELGNEQLNSVTPHYEGAILKSVMKQLDIDSNVEIPVGTTLNYQFGVKIRSGKNLIQTQYYNANNYVSQKVKLSVGSYTVSFTGDLASGIYVRKANGSNPINGTIITEGYNRIQMTFSISEENNYYIQFYRAGGFSTFQKAQLEEGTRATSYEDFGAYDYVNYGNYIVKDVEKQEDTRS